MLRLPQKALSDTGSTSETKPKRSLSKSKKSVLSPGRASSDMTSGAGLVKQGLSGPVLKYISAQDVIKKGKARGEEVKKKRERWPGET